VRKTTLSISLISLFLFSGCIQKKAILHVPIVPKMTKLENNSSTLSKTLDSSNIDETIISSQNTEVTTQDIIIDNNISIGTPIQVEPIESKEISQSIIQRKAFPLAEYKNLKKYGESTISGVMFLQKDGSKIFAQNAKLFLHPMTSYSKEWYEKSYIGGKTMSEADKRLYNYLLYTTTDGDGNFSFFAVAKGKYYVIGEMICGFECGYDKAKSILMAQEIEIGAKEKKFIKLQKNQ